MSSLTLSLSMSLGSKDTSTLTFEFGPEVCFWITSPCGPHVPRFGSQSGAFISIYCISMGWKSTTGRTRAAHLTSCCCCNVCSGGIRVGLVLWKSPEGTQRGCCGPSPSLHKPAPITPNHSLLQALQPHVWWHRGQRQACRTFSVLNQLWNCYLSNSPTPLLLLNRNTGQTGFLFASCMLQPTFTMFIPHHLFFTFFLKINRPVFSVSSHGGNFTSPFPFLSPFSEVCLALVQASCETWEYWVTCAVYLIPNVSASLTYIINCLYFTQQSLPCSFCSLTPCLTNKLELCSVRHRVTSVFFLPFSMQHFGWTKLNFCLTSYHPFIQLD